MDRHDIAQPSLHIDALSPGPMIIETHVCLGHLSHAFDSHLVAAPARVALLVEGILDSPTLVL